jgi:hypothetical protein
MIVMRNMDELFEIDIPEGWIAASHACACNPMKFAHYPVDWLVLFFREIGVVPDFSSGHQRIAHSHPWNTLQP